MSSKFVLKIEQSPVLNTKFGKAKLNKYGYYVITSRKEGNNKKLLHRLIFEKFYGPIPEGFDIHHKDGNKWNNCLFNLQLMRHSDHSILSNKGRNLSAETRAKISSARKGMKFSDEHKAKLSAANSGKYNPLSKYENIWDNSRVKFNKGEMFRKTGDLGKAFYLKYNGKHVKCGGFIDPLSCEIIHDIIKGEEE